MTESDWKRLEVLAGGILFLSHCSVDGWRVRALRRVWIGKWQDGDIYLSAINPGTDDRLPLFVSNKFRRRLMAIQRRSQFPPTAAEVRGQLDEEMAKEFDRKVRPRLTLV